MTKAFNTICSQPGCGDTHGESLVEAQPPPKPNDKPAVWDLVIADMKERDQVGRKRYGTPLQPFNGREAIVDAYQEGLDLVVYLRQAIEERDVLSGLLGTLIDAVEAYFEPMRGGHCASNAARVLNCVDVALATTAAPARGSR